MRGLGTGVADIYEIRTSRTEQQESVKRVIDDALAENFTSVVIIGVKENENFITMTSGLLSQTRIVGMIEFAKYDILKKANE